MSALKLSFALAASFLLPVASHAADMTVQVTGVRNADGVVTLCLWDKPQNFPNCNDRPVLQRASASAKQGDVTLHLKDVAPGTYAISLYHDEKKIGHAPTDLIGKPTVGVGVSRDARGTLSAPSFKDAAFTVGDKPGQLTIKIDYP